MQSRLSAIIFSLIFLTIGAISMNAMKEEQLKEKIGQMIIIGFKGTELQPNDAIVQAIMNQHIGGVILFDYDFSTNTFDRNIKNPVQLKHLTQQLQHYAREATIAHQNHLYPLLISIDYEGGKVNRLKENYGFPKTISAEEIGRGSKEQAKQYAEQMAETLQQEGINVNFGPVLDVNVNPDNPVIGKAERSFSALPERVVEFADIFSKAYQDHNIACAYKHFPGHGSSTGDTHAGFVDVTQTWKEYELNPYEELFLHADRCPIVMISHVVHYGLDKEGYPASLSLAITKNLLREKLNYNGLTVTDDLQMKAITDNYGVADAVRLAINAGIDLLIFGDQLVIKPQDPKEIVDIIYDDVMSGKIPESRIEESYQRIMKLKRKLMN